MAATRKRKPGRLKEPEGVVPTPWKVHEGQWANKGRLFIEAERNGGYKRWVAEIMAVCPGQERPTADRIVACVNALEGIADPAAAVALLRELAMAGDAVDTLLLTKSAATKGELVNVLTNLGRRAKEALG